MVPNAYARIKFNPHCWIRFYFRLRRLMCYFGVKLCAQSVRVFSSEHEQTHGNTVLLKWQAICLRVWGMGKPSAPSLQRFHFDYIYCYYVVSFSFSVSLMRGADIRAIHIPWATHSLIVHLISFLFYHFELASLRVHTHTVILKRERIVQKKINETLNWMYSFLFVICENGIRGGNFIIVELVCKWKENIAGKIKKNSNNRSPP